MEHKFEDDVAFNCTLICELNTNPLSKVIIFFRKASTLSSSCSIRSKAMPLIAATALRYHILKSSFIFSTSIVYLLIDYNDSDSVGVNVIN